MCLAPGLALRLPVGPDNCIEPVSGVFFTFEWSLDLVALVANNSCCQPFQISGGNAALKGYCNIYPKTTMTATH